MRFTCLVLLLSFVAAASHADESQTRDFEAVYKEWSSIDTQLEKLIESYRAAEPEEQKALLQNYNQLVATSRKLLPELRSSASSAYSQNPNEDPRITKTLIGLVANDVRQDRYEDALALGQALVDNNCSETIVYSFMGVAAYCTDDFATAETYLKRAKSENTLTQTADVCLQDLDTAKESWAVETGIRQREAKADDLPQISIQTSKGPLIVELYENEAPQAVANFISLVESGFYNGLTFHRVLPGFMAQGGCPDGDGRGGPGYNIYCECQQENHRKHFRGTLSMAHAGPNTGGSQFFLTFKRTSHLDGRHTVFGRVVKGLDILASLQRIDPGNPARGVEPDKILKAEVIRKRDHAYLPTKVGKKE